MKTHLFILIFLILQVNLFAQVDCAKTDINFTGFCSEFHSNGKVKWIKEFQDGQALGIWMSFDEKGNLVKQLNTKSKRDSLDKIYEETFHINLKDTTVYEFPEQEAQFNGNMLEYIVKNINYIEFGSGFYRSGSLKVYLKFIIEKDGRITNISIRKGAIDCPECDKEALRVIKAMPAWKPAVDQNKIVRSWCQVPIGFSLY